MDWTKFAWLKRGKRRIEILRIIEDSKTPLTINEIKQISKTALSQASLTVSELSSNNLIKCKNPNDKIGRLYEISDEGELFLSLLRGEI